MRSVKFLKDPIKLKQIFFLRFRLNKESYNAALEDGSLLEAVNVKACVNKFLLRNLTIKNKLLKPLMAQ